jgi:hypothetical protein
MYAGTRTMNWPVSPPASEQQMIARELVTRIVDRLWEALGRAQAHDRDRFVAQSLNPREVSQRIHRLEHASGSLQA